MKQVKYKNLCILMSKSIKLKNLKDNIEKMSKYHQLEILRILNNMPNVRINENNNGTFINLTELDDEILEPLEAFVEYVNEQKVHLEKVEQEKDRIQNIFFKGNKDLDS